jgi:hypothetical protein
MPTWLRDYLVLPLIVGVVVALFTIGLPWLFKDKSELSYTIDQPAAYLDDPALDDMQITVNGKPVSDIVGYRVKVWNSGTTPVKKLAARLVFDTNDQDFEVFALTHDTTPPVEFGQINELTSDPFSRRFEYDLLNPEDRDVVRVVTNKSVPIAFFAKAEGLSVSKVDETASDRSFVDILGVTAAVVGFLGAFLSSLFRLGVDRISKAMVKQRTVIDLHKVWNDVKDIDPKQPVIPDVVHAANVLDLTASLWNNNLIERNVLIESYWQEFRQLFDKLDKWEVVIPSLGKTGSDLLSTQVREAYQEMKGQHTATTNPKTPSSTEADK